MANVAFSSYEPLIASPLPKGKIRIVKLLPAGSSEKANRAWRPSSGAWSTPASTPPRSRDEGPGGYVSCAPRPTRRWSPPAPSQGGRSRAQTMMGWESPENWAAWRAKPLA